MIILDKFLQAREQEGRPIRVGLWGAGEMAKGMVNQVMRYTPGMVVSVIANRTLSKAHEAYEYTGNTALECNDLESLQACISSGGLVVTENAELLCEVDGLDLLVECTGTIHYAANLVMKAIQNKKHVLLFNPEVDATIGPIMKVYADKAGVMLSGCDGDQPGVIMNLYRFVKGLGLTPLICGNIKGLQDFYRNPTTQKGFAERWQLTPEMVTSFADGTKISIEQACVANATGMGVAKRGMLGYHHDGHIDDMTGMYDVEELKRLGGIVDYVVGPKPGPGVFVYATTDDPKTKHYLEYGKLGTGPLYSFYTPYHLIYAEIPISIARMVLFQDIVMAPLGGPVVEVITHAKTPLQAGHKLDGLGGYDTYGQCENAETARLENLLPVGLAEGCVLKRDVPRDHPITFDDVELPADNLVQRLYREQTAMFFPHLQRKPELV
ncbi:NAD(P)H-dependent oxidoreductase [Solirubrum puertoriconensis]|uniref:NAD(P)-dependent oxidoreductase n=1 Tax=Solirubrum puertoriconensis TaxID=1751427 RepID=A0A9X0HJX4_SOLP1|nr:NAD(P)-dependent oxidoreductase [Solirubrum puertoriconensis]KUG07176.1 NAD(P)-dependent oxidoreductase [Solirubrum puertoriconensis]